MIKYIYYKVYVRNLRLLLSTAREQYYVQRLCSFNNDIQRSWKVLDGLMGRSKKLLHKEFIVDGVSTHDTAKLATLSVIILFITLETSSNPFHSVALTISIILFLMICQSFFPLVTETESLESPMCMNKKCASTIFLVDSSSCEKNY